MLVWQSPSYVLHPGLDAEALGQIRSVDPEGARAEIDGEFLQGLSIFFDADALEACVSDERPPETTKGTGVGAADPASGSGKDSFAAAVAYADGARVALAAVRQWQPPFNPSNAIAEASDFFKSYNVTSIVGDKYAPGFVIEGFAQHGVTYSTALNDASTQFLEVLPLINSGRAVLLDHPELLRELRGLERRRGPSGRDRIGHRPAAHDDLAVRCVCRTRESCAKASDRRPRTVFGGVRSLPRRSAQPQLEFSHRRRRSELGRILSEPKRVRSQPMLTIEKEDDKRGSAHELRRLRVREISSVDRPANRRRFLIIKSEAAFTESGNPPPTRKTERKTERNNDMEAPNFENHSARVEVVTKLVTSADPKGIRERADALVIKFADAFQRANPALSRVAAETRAYEEHPQLYEADMAGQLAGEDAPSVAPVVKTHVATERQKIEQELEQRVDKLFAATTSLTREQCWGLVYENDPQLISRLNKATSGY